MARASDAKALRDEQQCLVQLQDCLHLSVIEFMDRFLDELDFHAASVMPAGMFDLRRFEQLEDPAAKQNYRAAKGRPTGG